MTGLVRKATLLAVCGLLSAGVAFANVPDPANSECHNVGAEGLGLFCPGATGNFSIFVVGNLGGTVDPVGEFCVTVRNFNNVPIGNASVVIDFSDCDLQLCTNQLDAAVTVDCVSQTVRKNTNASGVACFRVRGKSRSPGSLGCGGAIKDCAKIFADGVLLCSADAPTYDLVSQLGEDGMNPNDLSEWLHLSFDCVPGPTRGNYDCTNHDLDPNDLSIFLFVSFAGNSAENCAGAKDPVVGPKCP
jgi:hypothetical protein